MCLQMKSCYDTIGNLASDVSNKSINIVNKCDKPAVKQVNNFICDGFVLWMLLYALGISTAVCETYN